MVEDGLENPKIFKNRPKFGFQNLAEHAAFKPLTIFAKNSILDVRLDSECISDIPVKNAAEKNEAFF